MFLPGQRNNEYAEIERKSANKNPPESVGDGQFVQCNMRYDSASPSENFAWLDVVLNSKRVSTGHATKIIFLNQMDRFFCFLFIVAM